MAVADLIAQTLAQHISNPRVISYAGTKLNEVQGRFIAANRVYNFVLDKKGVSYSPAGRNDSLVFSALFLERLDAARKPKVGSDRCNAGKSYQCGKTCISNRWNCRKGVKDVNDARRIASILASTNEKLKAKASGEVSEKAQARGRALFEARQNRVSNPKSAYTPTPEEQEILALQEKKIARLKNDIQKLERGDKPRKLKEAKALLERVTKDHIAYKAGLSTERKEKEALENQEKLTNAAKLKSEIDSLVNKKAAVTPQKMSITEPQYTEQLKILGALSNESLGTPIKGEQLWRATKKDIVQNNPSKIVDGFYDFVQPISTLEEKGWIAKVSSQEWSVSSGATALGIPIAGFTSGDPREIKNAVKPKKNDDPQGFTYVLTRDGAEAYKLTTLKKSTKALKDDEEPSFSQINSLGGGGQAPRGGKYVIDVKGDEIFYRGGQFLPEAFSSKTSKSNFKKNWKRLLSAYETKAEEPFSSKNSKITKSEVQGTTAAIEFTVGNLKQWVKLPFKDEKDAQEFISMLQLVKLG